MVDKIQPYTDINFSIFYVICKFLNLGLSFSWFAMQLLMFFYSN